MWPKHKSLYGNVSMKITWLAAISLLNSHWYPVFLELIKGYKLTMPAVCMEHISGISCVTVSLLQSYSIFCAMGRALCSCQATRISAPLLPAESGSKPSVPGMGRSVQIFFPVWQRFACCSEYTWAMYPHSEICMEQRGCCSSILLADGISWVLAT